MSNQFFAPPSNFKFVLFFLLLVHCLPTYAQSDECGTIMTSQDYQIAASQKSAIEQAKALAAQGTTAVVPVRLHVVLPDNGSSSIDNSYAETVLSNLEQKFSSAGYGFDFILCGDINYIKNSSFYNGIVPVHDYSYSTHTANVYVLKPGGVSNADWPWVGNKVFMYTSDLLAPTLPHEFAHHFGVLHNFDPSVMYQVPPNPSDPGSQVDHPYGTQNDQHARELVIDATTPGALFPVPNHGNSGDWVADTPAGCNPNSSFTHPGCSFNISNCTYNGTYLDYNGMPINDPTNILAKNIMSYGVGNCAVQFTQGQKDRAFGYYEDIRKHQYRPLSCGNLDDKVEFEGTSHGLKKVSVKLSQPGGSIPYLSHSLTNENGEFDGVLYNQTLSNTVNANVRKLGSNPDFSYKYADWINGVTTFDLVKVSRHLLFQEPLNGYQLLAADVNKSNSVTTFDVVLIRKLILAQNSTFPAFDQPWRYIREDIPLDNPSHFDGGSNFDDNPFQFANLDGTANYPVWGLNGKAGFDGVKLGDVNGTNSEANLVNNNSSTLGDPVYVDVVKTVNGNQATYDFRVTDFEDVVAYQLDIQFTEAYLDYMQSLERELSGVNPEFFGATNADEGIIRTLWYDEVNLSPVTLNDLDRIFSLVFDGLANDPNADVSILESVGFRASDENASLNNFAISSDGTIRPIIQRRLQDDKIAAINTSPNPFTDELWLQVEAIQAGEVEIALFNATGQQVYRAAETLTKGSNSIGIEGLSGLPDGFYLLTVVSNGKSFTRKVVKSTP